MNTIQILKSLGDETRLRIVNILKDGALCVCEIEAILEITQSNASRHLNKLMTANIVNYYKEGKFIYYKLNQNTLDENQFIKELIDSQLPKEEKLRYDYDILQAYRNAGLGCENVAKVKEIIEKINKKM